MAQKSSKSATPKNSKKSSEVTKNGSQNCDTSKSTAPSLVVCALVALISFTAGLWTRPLLEASRGTAFDVGRFLVSWTNKCDEEALSHFLHAKPVAGLHVICFNKESGGNVGLKMFAGARETTHPTEVTTNSSWLEVRNSLVGVLKIKPQDELHQAWAVFSHVGERIVDEDTSGESDGVVENLVNSGLVLLFEGGQWMWPGVRIGYKRTVDLYSIIPGPKPNIKLPKHRTAMLETLSLQPLVLSTENFLSEEECNHVQKTALPSMRHSSVSFTDADRGKDAAEFRTSSNTFIDAEDDMLRDIDYRTASLVRIPRAHQEQVQVLRYEKTQHYVAHHDYFNPIFYSQDKATLAMIKNGLKNRLATVFWYLSDVQGGGETVFPRWNGAPQPTDFKDCSVGLKVKPRRGKVIIFYSLTADGELDEYSMHGACPVEEGVKWAANKWVWNLPTWYIEEGS